MMIDEYYTWLIYGYHSNDLMPHAGKYVVVVCDDCGVYNSMPMWQYNRNNDLCKSCAQTGIKRPKYQTRTPEHNAAASKAALAPKKPLPDGWQSKLSDTTTNKECSTYLGDIAEIILSNIYDSVQVMPRNNHGFDVICNRDYKIDVKASATGDKLGYWLFNIKKNTCADHFLCIAFNSRDDLKNPVHLWLIPGHVTNHLTSLQISKSNIDGWSEYELSLDKLRECCNNLSDNAKEIKK